LLKKEGKGRERRGREGRGRERGRGKGMQFQKVGCTSTKIYTSNVV